MNTQHLIDNIKAEGFAVFGPKKLTSYVYFTDGERIGYAQVDRMFGVKYSTVNKPCKQCGTGFHADSVQSALAHAPHWAPSGDRAAVRKYKDFDEFQSKHWQPLVQY